MTDDLRPPYRIAFDNARDPYAARNALGIAGTGAGLITSVTSPLSVTGGNLTIDLSGYGTTADDIPHCGRLEYVSTTALSFKPYNGDRIKIAGSLYAIPSAGIAGLTNSGLSASTVYYVYAYNNAGTITGEFSTTTHAVSSTAGNVGIEIKSGDNTRTLLGMVRTNASSQFQSDAANRLVISWLNRRNRSLLGASTAGAGTTSGSAVELTTSARVYFLTWAEEAVASGVSGAMSTSAGSAFADIGLDAATQFPFPSDVSSPGLFFNAVGTISFVTTEASHFITPLGWVSAGTGSWHCWLSGMIRG